MTQKLILLLSLFLSVALLSHGFSIPLITTKLPKEAYTEVTDYQLPTLTARDKKIGLLVYHGMGDSGLSTGIQNFALSIAKELNIYATVQTVVLGDGEWKDRLNSYFMPAKTQVETVCENIKAWNKQYKLDEWHAIGVSQGSQLLRAIVQECDDSRITKLVSLGGQHEGVYGVPHCAGSSFSILKKMCEYANKVLQWGAYDTKIQDKLVQAQYWHDPVHPLEYETKCTWLPFVNNYADINYKYRENIANLKTLILVKFNDDEMVIPKESSHFEFYKENDPELNIVPLRESRLYKEDRIGIRSLDEKGRLHLLSVDGNHLRFTWEWFVDNVLSIMKRDI